MFKHPDLGAHIVQLRKSKEYFKNIIEEKSSSDQYKSTPQIIFNLNLAFHLSTFSTPAETSRWTSFNCIIPATKSIILIAGNRGFSIQSFEQFKIVMKSSKNIDINPSSAPVDQILIIDDRDLLRFAKVDESIHLYCQAGPYAHVFKNIVDQIVLKETNMLDQIQQLSTLHSASYNEINRHTRNVLDLLLGPSNGESFVNTTRCCIYFVIFKARMTFQHV